ncbi:MAG TPA: methyl-accepting chemotaxis protein [Bryobacteraceae bacterium]|nr:methyl-accepting chemotaxis protein [Bryobacteraceae bacterium]
MAKKHNGNGHVAEPALAGPAAKASGSAKRQNGIRGEGGTGPGAALAGRPAPTGTVRLERPRVAELPDALHDRAAYFLQISLPIFVLDLEHNVVDANPAAADLVGWTRERLQGASYFDVLDHPACRNGTCAAARAIQSGRRVTDWATPQILGRAVPLLVSAEPIFDYGRDNSRDNGRVTGVIQIFTDVSEEEKLAQELLRVVTAVQDGDLSARPIEQAFNDRSKVVLGGVRDLIEALGAPLKTAIEHVDRIARGDIPEPITEEYRGDLNKLKNSLNGCIENITGFVAEMTHMAEEHDKGDIDVVIPAEKFHGAHRAMVQGVNNMVGSHIAAKKKAMACVAEFGKGNFEAPLERFPGKKAFINDTIEQVRSNLKNLIGDLHLLSGAAVDGKLTTRADGSRHQGDFRKIVEGVNATLNAVLEPINEAAAVLARIAGQDLTAAVMGDYRGDHAAIKNNINQMTADLRESLGQVKKSAASVSSSAGELIGVSQQMAGNAEETATQANMVSAASEQVTQNINTVSSATEQMQTSIREIAKNSNEAARVAKHAVDVAQSTNRTITKLGASSAEIGNVVKVITSIAQQTNLLALNATIEAARAGEAGKGFAVVANEVKELAKQTAKATEEISKKIEAIQSDTGGAVKAIDEIGAIINQINDITNSIASAVEEQTVTTNEISRSVGEAASGSADISKNISGVAMTAQGTTRGAIESQQSAEALNQMAEQLQAVVGRFKV